MSNQVLSGQQILAQWFEQGIFGWSPCMGHCFLQKMMQKSNLFFTLGKQKQIIPPIIFKKKIQIKSKKLMKI